MDSLYPSMINFNLDLILLGNVITFIMFVIFGATVTSKLTQIVLELRKANEQLKYQSHRLYSMSKPTDQPES